MSENDVKVSYNDEFLTLNQITDLTGGHYQTIKKIVEKMVANNDIEMGSVVRKNRTFPAYKLNHKNIAEIQIILKEIKSSSDLRRRLLDIGLINNTKIECVGQSPSGDPKAFLIRGAVIALRSEDGNNIIVNCIDKEG